MAKEDFEKKMYNIKKTMRNGVVEFDLRAYSSGKGPAITFLMKAS